jgi:hypothetical protein
MTLPVLIRVAVNSLAKHRLRSGLTTLGVAIGIAATLCTVALGEGSASVIHDDLLALGDNLLWVQASVIRAGGVRDRAGGVAATLTAEDSVAIAREVPEISRCTPQVDSPIQVIHGNQNWRTTCRDVSPEYLQDSRVASPDRCRFHRHGHPAPSQMLILSHDRRRVASLNVTDQSTSAWTRQQIREVFPDDNALA